MAEIAETRCRSGLYAKWGFCFVVGCAALPYSAVGALLPILPTTPFAVLTGIAFGKRLPGLQAWPASTRSFGPIIADWTAGGGLARIQ